MIFNILIYEIYWVDYVVYKSNIIHFLFIPEVKDFKAMRWRWMKKGFFSQFSVYSLAIPIYLHISYMRCINLSYRIYFIYSIMPCINVHIFIYPSIHSSIHLFLHLTGCTLLHYTIYMMFATLCTYIYIYV